MGGVVTPPRPPKPLTNWLPSGDLLVTASGTWGAGFSLWRLLCGLDNLRLVRFGFDEIQEVKMGGIWDKLGVAIGGKGWAGLLEHGIEQGHLIQ